MKELIIDIFQAKYMAKVEICKLCCKLGGCIVVVAFIFWSKSNNGPCNGSYGGAVFTSSQHLETHTITTF